MTEASKEDMLRLEDKLDRRLDRIETKLDQSMGQSQQHAILCDADRGRMDKAIAVNAATNHKQEIRWAKVVAWAAGSGIAGAGILEGLLKFFE